MEAHLGSWLSLHCCDSLKTSGPFRVTVFALATSLSSCLICEVNHYAADGKSPFSYGLQCYRGHVFLPRVSSSIRVTWSGISCSVYVIKKKKKPELVKLLFIKIKMSVWMKFLVTSVWSIDSNLWKLGLCKDFLHWAVCMNCAVKLEFQCKE